MANNFSPSVNIIRDSIKSFYYIPTPNTNNIVQQIANDYISGIRSFNIIGSYGTGKSSFLLALEKSLMDQKPYFKIPIFKNHNIATIKLVGDYSSLIESFATALGLRMRANITGHILTELLSIYNGIKGKNRLLLIEIDEFGKFLEYAAKNNPESEMYFAQQLAELVNNTNYNMALLTTMHQSFESYAIKLNTNQKQEWNKVKGRFRDLLFNEPTEQLLYLAAEHIEKTNPKRGDKKQLTQALNLYKRIKGFSSSDAFYSEVSSRFFPIDPVSAQVLTMGMQRYGQNERSLFTFLQATDHTSLVKFRPIISDFFSLDNVFEHFYFNFYPVLQSKHNADFAQWVNITHALERVDSEFDKQAESAKRIIKTIGLLNIFASAGAIFNDQIICEYASLCLGIKEPKPIIDQLSKKGIIRFRKHSNRFVIFEGTDVDIDAALIEVGNRVSNVEDIRTAVEKHIQIQPILAKKYSYINGSPRYFKFRISDSPIRSVNPDEADGYVNLIFNSSLSTKELVKNTQNVDAAILYALFKNTEEIREVLTDIEKTQVVLSEHYEDITARREIERILLHQKNLLSHFVLHGLFNGSEYVEWVWNGEKVQINSSKHLNLTLSEICFSVFKNAPEFRLELVNREKLSGQIHTARKNLFIALNNNWPLEDLGFDKDKFPAEKTIYLSLIKNNGLDYYSKPDDQEISIAKRSTFYPLWQQGIEFLESTKKGRRNLQEFVDILRAPRFGLKNGFIQIWVPIFLFYKRNDFAIFHEESFIPELSADIMDLISRKPSDYEIKTFDIEGVRLELFNSYRKFLSLDDRKKVNKKSFIEAIKPFLAFYKELPEYSKSTTTIPKTAIALRSAIAQSKDPEKAFFEDFPAALGHRLDELNKDHKLLGAYTQSLQDSLKLLKNAFDDLLNRFESFIQNEILFEELSFEDYKKQLQKRFKGIKVHRLASDQKILIVRINSALESRNDWLNSLAQAVMGRPLEKLKDAEEEQLYDRLKSSLSALDSLTTLSKANVNDKKEDVLGLQLDSFADGIRRSVVRIPKSKSKEIESLRNKLRKNLNKDKSLNIAALAKLLEELISK